MPKRFHEGSTYAGHDKRRMQEIQDGHMLNEDHSAIANMPQEVKMHEWPSVHEYLPEELNDTISGIDRQIGMDIGQRNKHLHPKKV